MLRLVTFSVFLVGMVFLVEPCSVLCGSSLSSGLIPSEPQVWYAFSLIALFFVLRSSAGFILLAPSIVSASMSPESAALIIVVAIVLSLRRYVEWMPFVLLAASILLVLLVGVPLAALGVLALLIPLIADIPSLVWRIRATAAWFLITSFSLIVLSRYVTSFSFDLLGFSMVPLDPVVFVALSIASVLSLRNDEYAQLIRALMLLWGSLLLPALAFFAMPIIVGLLASQLMRSMGEEHLRGARMSAITLIVVSLALPLIVSPGPVGGGLRVENAIVFTPEYFDLACEGRTYPQRLGPGDLASLAAIDDPGALVPLFDEGVTTFVYPEDFDEPIVFAFRYVPGVVFDERGSVIVASLS